MEKTAKEARLKQEIEGMEEQLMMRSRWGHRMHLMDLGKEDKIRRLPDADGSNVCVTAIESPQELLKRLQDDHTMCVVGPPASGKTLCMAQVACAAMKSVNLFIKSQGILTLLIHVGRGGRRLLHDVLTCDKRFHGFHSSAGDLEHAQCLS